MIKRLERDLRNLSHLRQFALPIIDILADWPDRASWGEWLDRFNGACRPRPQSSGARATGARGSAADGRRHRRRPRGSGRVLHDRLASLDWKPPARRYGRLFVGTPHQARGRRFRIVFVPGLAERVVPQRPREDPLLLDECRTALAGDLMRQDERASAERLLLKIAIGAATERLYLSYPRLDSNAEGRARVPSFYALDVMRAITGSVPDYRVLAQEAAEEAGASLGWPAPLDPDRAIDDLEHDLAVLKPLLESRDVAAVKGRAHYMLGLNQALHRSVTSRWLRDKKPWSKSDGLVATAGTTATLAPYLAKHRLGQRPYSLSALQRFATCPVSVPARHHSPPRALDRARAAGAHGSADARVACSTRSRPNSSARCTSGTPCRSRRRASPRRPPSSTTILDRVAKDYEETLAPAIERVWKDEIDDLRRDLSHLGPAHGRRAGVDPRVLRVQLRVERRRTRSAESGRSDRRR